MKYNNKNIEFFRKQLKGHNQRKALGYEDTLAFNFGYIVSLYTNKVVSRKEYNVLLKEFSYESEND